MTLLFCLTEIIARQDPSESGLCISMKYASSMSDDVVVLLKLDYHSTGGERERFTHFNEVCVFRCSMNMFGCRSLAGSLSGNNAIPKDNGVTGH